MEQLCLFSKNIMKRMERKPPKVKNVRSVGGKPVVDDLMITAMQECMRDGDYEGPETAEELCGILGFL